MARLYYLGPWIPPDPKDPLPAWRGPTGTIGAVDLRGSGGGAGLGFFTTAEEIIEPGYEPFGSAKGERLDSLTMSAEQRAAWASTLGVPESPDGSTLLDLLWDALTIYSDPDGVTGPKPIMPTSRGTVDLHLAGHSLVRSTRMPEDPTALPHWNKVQRVLQSGFREVADVAARGETQKQRDLHKRWLGFQQEKYGLSTEAATALIVPEDMPRTSPMKPETTITDDFNAADSGTLGADLSWTVVRGDWDNKTNQAAYITGTTADVRAESDLSGADHYAQANLVTLDGGAGTAAGFGMCARFDSGADTFYLAWFRNTSGTIPVEVLIYKVVAGSFTEILGASSITGSLPEPYKIEVNGSTIKAYQNGVERGSVTDTSITGGTRCGMAAFAGAGGYAVMADDFEAADLGGGSSSISVSDTGSGSEAPTVAAAVPVADTGAGSDAPGVAAAVPPADTGSGSDAPSIAAGVPVADAGAGADAPTVAASVSVADVGAGVEAIGILVSVDVGDAGSGSEGSVPGIGVDPSDTGSGSESLALAAAVPVSDTGHGTDGVSVPEGSPPRPSPSGVRFTTPSPGRWSTPGGPRFTERSA